MNHLIVIYDDVVFLLGKYCCRMYHQQPNKTENMYFFFTFEKSQSIVLFIIQINSNEHGTQVKSHTRYLLNKFNKARSFYINKLLLM